MRQSMKPPPRVENITPPRVNKIHDSPPRVNWKEPILSESSSPTAPNTIKNTRWNHQRKTRANTPTLLYEENETKTQQHNTITANPYEEKENIQPTPHIIPPDEPTPKTTIKPRRSSRIFLPDDRLVYPNQPYIIFLEMQSK